MEEPTCGSLRAFGGEPVSVLATLTAKDSANTIRQLIRLQLEQVGARLGLPFLPRPEDQTAVVVTRNEGDAFATAVEPETVRTTSAVHPS